MNPKHNLKQYLLNNCQGLDKARTAKQIKQDLGIPTRQIPLLTLKLLDEGICVCSVRTYHKDDKGKQLNHKIGYYIATNEAEAMLHFKELEDIVKANTVRKYKVLHVIRETLYEQLRVI